MYNNRKIFSDAWALAKKTGGCFSNALKTVWDWHRKKVYADKKANQIIAAWNNLNTKEVETFIKAKSEVNQIVSELKTAYNKLQKTSTANIIASVLTNKHKTPTYPQLFAILCGAWENGIIIKS